MKRGQNWSKFADKNLPVHDEIVGVKKSDFLFNDISYGWPPSKSKSLERQPSWPWRTGTHTRAKEYKDRRKNWHRRKDCFPRKLFFSFFFAESGLSMHFLGAGAAARSLKSQNTNVQDLDYDFLRRIFENNWRNCNWKKPKNTISDDNFFDNVTNMLLIKS